MFILYKRNDGKVSVKYLFYDTSITFQSDGRTTYNNRYSIRECPIRPWLKRRKYRFQVRS